ncbi:unnamed protein product [Pseudo-nitzschia multistriata]|uniref:FAD/NAD(P)-binding domain-containing protein n=1 Tax=Pseudo-nitzschia multistriata TaxID=183589 RepID=A0A448YXH6_9STRA|nr:unnamed protein product [Pseudo-nitzschia multistriata]
MAAGGRDRGAPKSFRCGGEIDNDDGSDTLDDNSFDSEHPRKNGGDGDVDVDGDVDLDDGPSVAIVGAGFAGLVLANYLETHPSPGSDDTSTSNKTSNSNNNNNSNHHQTRSGRRWRYVLFESKPASGIPVIGTLRLDSAGPVLEELGLSEAARTGGVFPAGGPGEVSREAFLEVLRKRPRVASSHRVVAVHPSETAGHAVVTVRGGGTEPGDETTAHGPFDAVVLSHGLVLPSAKRPAVEGPLSSVLRIGDSRDRPWWDLDVLGARRRRSGADRAIRDGLEAGRELVRRLGGARRSKACGGVAPGTAAPGTDPPAAWRAAAVVVVPVLLAAAAALAPRGPRPQRVSSKARHGKARQSIAPPRPTHTRTQPPNDMVATDPSKARRRTLVRPGTAWALVFFPALFYYSGTRLYSLGLFRSSTCGRPLPHRLEVWDKSPGASSGEEGEEGACPGFLAAHRNNKKDALVYPGGAGCSSLRYPPYLVQEGFDGVESTAWMEDEELGRGYLLLSTSAGTGRIYRWEAGGGPIAIGRTLYARDAGCRSGLYKDCGSGASGTVGSGGIAPDAYGKREGRPSLVVAEYGEGRVVRLEENGARTPLIVGTTQEGGDRLARPFRLLVTPYGDLLAVDDESGGRPPHGEPPFVLWRLEGASGVPGLASLAASRRAHAWNRNNATGLPRAVLRSGEMGGLALDPSGQRVLLTTTAGSDNDNDNDHAVVVLSLPLLDDLDENDGDGGGSLPGDAVTVFDYTAHASHPGAIEVDNHGNLYLAVENAILVVSKSTTYVAKISFPAGERIVDLTLGSDHFLYVAMETKLARIRVPNTPIKVRKDLLIKA